MRSVRLLAFACAVSFLSVTTAQAATVTFETLTDGSTTPTDDLMLGLMDAYTSDGISVTFGFDTTSDGKTDTSALFEDAAGEPSETGVGFLGSEGIDTADVGFAAQLGDFFLRQPGTFGSSSFGTFIIDYTYDSSSFLVTAASGEIWDIDGSGVSTPSTSDTEEFTVTAVDLLGGTHVLVSPLGTLTSGSAPLDGRPWVFGFSNISDGIDRIEITFTGSKTSGVGLAFNNFSPDTNLVPSPAAAGLGLSLLGLLGITRPLRRRRAG